MKFFPSLKNNSDIGSLCRAISRPEDIVNKAIEQGLPAVALTDYGSLAGSIEFLNAAKDKNIKPILGEQFFINDDPARHEKDNQQTTYLNVLSRSLEGWKSLVKVHNEAQKNHYGVPRISLSSFGNSEGLICYSGHVGTAIAGSIFTDSGLAYQARSYDEAKGYIDPDWYKKCVKEINKHKDVFGDNFFLSVCDVDKENWPVVQVISKAIRHIAKKQKLKVIGIADSHYIHREDARDQHIVLCKGMKTTIPKVMSAMAAVKAVENSQFFRSMNYGMISPERANELYSEEELENTLEVADRIEKYSLFGPPQLPIFDCPDGMSPDEYLTHLAREGWKRKIQGVVPKARQSEYASRIKNELDVLRQAGISKYFLVVNDYIRWIKSQGWLTGFGRGSAAGCLTSYLLGMTGVDPILDDLLFERFYSAGRISEDKITLPDFDLDIEPEKREPTIQYIREKYGRENVLQVSTFGRLMGRGCIKEVLRSHEACSFMETNKITEFIPDQAKISDDLQEMKNEGEEASIVRWALKNNAKQLKEWAYYDHVEGEEKIYGPLAKFFEQSIRLEGVRVTQGVHAAALLIMPPELSEKIPCGFNKNDQENLICNVDMDGAEKFGALKVDLLGLSALTTIRGVAELLMED